MRTRVCGARDGKALRHLPRCYITSLNYRGRFFYYPNVLFSNLSSMILTIITHEYYQIDLSIMNIIKETFKDLAVQ